MIYACVRTLTAVVCPRVLSAPNANVERFLRSGFCWRIQVQTTFSISSFGSAEIRFAWIPCPMCWNEPEVEKFARPLPDSLCPILFGVWNPKIAILKSFKWCLRIKILFGKSSYQRWNTLCAFHKFRSMLKPQTGCQKVPRPGQLAILPGVRYLI